MADVDEEKRALTLAQKHTAKETGGLLFTRWISSSLSHSLVKATPVSHGTRSPTQQFLDG